MGNTLVASNTALATLSDVMSEGKGYLYSKYGIESIDKCVCGALTLQTSNKQVSVKPENASEFFPEMNVAFWDAFEKIIPNWCHCDHCVNHYGLDLCACGSGEKPEDCDADFEMCGTPYQTIYDLR